MLPLQLQSHLLSCSRAPSLTATFHPFNEDLQQQHPWKQCNKVMMKTTVGKTMRATSLGVVSHPYQPLPLLNAPSQHPFMACCLLHQYFNKSCLLQTKLTGLLLSVDTQWSMTASISITPNHQLLSSRLQSCIHRVATNCADLTAVKPCWHRGRHFWQLSAVVLWQVTSPPASTTFVRLRLKPLSRPLLRRLVLCNYCTTFCLVLNGLCTTAFHTGQKAKLDFPVLVHVYQSAG